MLLAEEREAGSEETFAQVKAKFEAEDSATAGAAAATEAAILASCTLANV